MKITGQNRKYILINICICLLIFPLSTIYSQNIKVFILAGQSNMQGHGNINPPNTNGTLSNFMDSNSSTMFQYIQNTDGSWATREDVWVRYDHENGELLADKLKVGYGGFEGQIGPELGFGHLLGEHFQDQVLIIKTCWGGKSLAVDFRPPSSGGIVGPYYNQMISDITETINNINIEFPQYNGGQIDIAGFCWFQGWNDGEQNSYLNEYEENLKNLISDVRADFNVPDLPFVVGLTGNGGYDLLQGDLWIQGLQTILVPAQVNAVEYTGHYNVRYAETRDYWIPADSSPADAGHHWHNNAESYLRIGNVLGLKMIELLGVINSKKNLISAPQNIKVFPSPANNYFQTECEQNNFHLNILDINGRIVESLKDISSSTKINIEKLKEGIYFIDILNLDGSSIGIKQLVKN